jgi:hypothetical protein
MADSTIVDLTALTGANSAPGDLLTLVDVSDTTMDAAGTNKSITRQELQTYNAGTLTTDVKVLDLSATWNDAGVTFTGLKFNVTNTASNAASLLVDLQVGGVTQFNVTRAGQIRSAGSTVILNASDKAVYLGPSQGGMRQITNGSTTMMGGAAYSTTFSANGSINNSSQFVGWSGEAQSYTTLTPDLSLYRDGASDTLAQRRTTNAQTFRLYRTWTDASNYQRLTSTWSTSTALIHNEGAGTSADGSIAFNDAALATDTTKGFIMIPSCAGAPTGTPADIPTGQIPIVFDSTNNKLYVYDGGWISTAALT